jgi:hypothetical protein
VGEAAEHDGRRGGRLVVVGSLVVPDWEDGAANPGVA